MTLASNFPPLPPDDTVPGVPVTDLGRRLARITQVAGIGYWSVNRRQRRRRWSAELRMLHGLAESEALPGSREWLQHYVHPDDRERTRELLMHWLAGGDEVLELSLRILRRDGSLREVLTHSLADRENDDVRFGVVIDVTPIRRAEQALQQAEGRAALTASAIGLGTWEIDLQTREARWDAPMWLLRGRAPRAGGQPSIQDRRDSLHPDDVDRVAMNNRGGGSDNYEFRVLWPDGQVRWLAARSTTLHDDQGRPLRRIGVNWDITAHREAQAALHQREMALREAETRTRTLARMSHELRTPLNAILGCAHLLRLGCSDAAQQRRQLDEIETAGRDLLAMVDHVLDLTGRSADAGDGNEAANLTAELWPSSEGGAGPNGQNGTNGTNDLHGTATTAPDAARGAADGARPALPAPSAPRRTVLYIEDNAVNAMIVSELIARRGDLDVIIAETGLAGLAQAQARRPELVLLDMQLPDIDGHEVFRRLRADARTAALPCIAVSANALHADIDAALAAGMTDYWTKPLDFRAFVQSLEAMFGPAPAAAAIGAPTR